MTFEDFMKLDIGCLAKLVQKTGKKDAGLFYDGPFYRPDYNGPGFRISSSLDDLQKRIYRDKYASMPRDEMRFKVPVNRKTKEIEIDLAKWWNLMELYKEKRERGEKEWLLFKKKMDEICIYILENEKNESA
jgi:hypothetical protein